MTLQLASIVCQFKPLVAGILDGAARLLFPPTCPGCGRLLARPGTLCGPCWSGLHFLDEPWCAVLGVPFTHFMGEGAVSAEAIANPPPFRRARSAVLHTGTAREMVHALKYRDSPGLARWMALWMARAGTGLLDDADVIVPVPLHWRRFLRRRFNQSAELARALAALSEKPFEPMALARVRPTRQQARLALPARQENLRSAFRVPPDREALVRGRNVLLIDDVYTTGSTAWACARALMRSGAAAVDVLTFARVLPGDFSAGDTDLI